jgi:maleylacetate reductase
VMESFAYNALPMRVLFGRGTLQAVGAEVERLGAKRALVLTTQQQEVDGLGAGAILGARFAGLFSGAVAHTPADVTEAALASLRNVSADCVVSLGGGSTIGLGKALARRTGVDQVCIPSTYAGSEMTPILGETREGVKTTVNTSDVLPESVIYDVDLTLTLPQSLSATSGINAIAHAVEALYAKDRNPIVSLMAEEGIRSLAHALPVIASDAGNIKARSAALYGAWLCGSCLGAVGMALHHKLCHTLGGSFNLPHSETHTILLPHVLAYNAEAAPEAAAAVGRALGTDDPVQRLFDLIAKLGVPQALSKIGMPADGIERAAALAVEKPYWNPRPIARDAIRDLIARAHAGERPSHGAAADGRR